MSAPARVAPGALDHEPETPTVIDAGAQFDGTLTFRGSARIRGELVGRVVAEGTLWIDDGARVQADLEVDEVVVGGEVEGEIVARERVELLATSRVRGVLRAPRFALAEGCRFEGRFETVSAEDAVAEPESAATAPETAETAHSPA